MRTLLAVSMAALLLLGFALPPAASGDGLVTAHKVLADGSTQAVRARLLTSQPPALQGLPWGTFTPPADQDLPPSDAGSIESEKERVTKDITFYGHVFGNSLIPTDQGDGEFGPGGPQAANTIFPTGDANLGLGLFDWCSDTVNFQGLTPPQPSPWTGCDKDPNNKVGLFLTAGPVQVHSPDDFRYSKLHNERGRTKDLVLDTAGEVKAWLWMSLDYHSWSVGNIAPGDDGTFCVITMPPDVGCPYPYWGWDPAIWPQWVVEAKLFMVELGEYGQGASEPPPIFEAWNSDSMTLIAEGATPAADITNGLPGSPNVHEFEVSLGAPTVDVIPKTHDVVLVYSFYSVLNGQKVSMHTWRVWAGELFPARFSLPVKNPLDVELVIPQFVHNKLLVHSVISSAFGSYDVDVPSAQLTILGPDNRPVVPQTMTRVGDYQVAHGAHFKPVNITWVWDYKADGARSGAYKVLVQACNQQGSACEVTEGGFTLGADLEPTDVRVGRAGQRTISDAQLGELTQGGLQQQGLAPAVARSLHEVDAGQVAGNTAKAVPGFEALLVFAAAGAALVLRRRWL